MADFEKAYEKTLQLEGGYLLHEVEGDRGGMTYAGIARNFWPKWEGWDLLDSGQREGLTPLVKEFYRKHFWNKIHGDSIDDQATAESIYDFAVNAGVKISSKIAQLVVGSTPDGCIGVKTLTSINDYKEDFPARFAICRIARYSEIVGRNSKQLKFLRGWINRSIEVVEV